MLADDETLIEKAPPKRTDLIVRNRRIRHDENHLGEVTLWFSPEEVKVSQTEMLRTVIMVTVVILAILILGTQLILSALLNAPLNQLIQGIRTIARGEYRLPHPP